LVSFTIRSTASIFPPQYNLIKWIQTNAKKKRKHRESVYIDLMSNLL
jgi:hypothetical protein